MAACKTFKNSTQEAHARPWKLSLAGYQALFSRYPRAHRHRELFRPDVPCLPTLAMYILEFRSAFSILASSRERDPEERARA